MKKERFIIISLLLIVVVETFMLLHSCRICRNLGFAEGEWDGYQSGYVDGVLEANQWGIIGIDGIVECTSYGCIIIANNTMFVPKNSEIELKDGSHIRAAAIALNSTEDYVEVYILKFYVYAYECQ